MLKICSYCEKHMDGEPDDSGKITHGMCTECFDYFDRQLNGLDFSAYLDQFQQPIAVIDADGRALYLNAALAQTLGKNKESYLGMRGGEVMECLYAGFLKAAGTQYTAPPAQSAKP